MAWTEKVTNKEIKSRMGDVVSLETQITKRRLAYFGPVVRACGLEYDIMLKIGDGIAKSRQTSEVLAAGGHGGHRSVAGMCCRDGEGQGQVKECDQEDR